MFLTLSKLFTKDRQLIKVNKIKQFDQTLDIKCITNTNEPFYTNWDFDQDFSVKTTFNRKVYTFDLTISSI